MRTTDDAGRSSRHGTADVHRDDDTVRRAITIRRPMAEVEEAWRAGGMPGTAAFRAAPGDRGTEVRVTAPREAQSAMREILGALASDDPAETLSTALRELRARLETGEVPTIKGQPSGRESK